MKKYLKIIVPTLVLTLVFSLLFLVPSEAKIDKDVCYATWATEEDYIANPEEPKATYKSNKFTTAAIKSSGYVKCFTDVVVDSAVELPVGCNTVIDLNGYELTASAKIIVNGSETTKIQAPGKLLIKNGDIVHTAAQFIQGRSNAEVYFDNVDINVNGGNTFVTAYSMRLLHFNNCNVTITKNNNVAFEIGVGYNPTGADTDNNGADYVINVLFENTVFTDNSTTGKDIFNIPDSSGRICYINISFGYGSSFNKISDKFLVVKNTNSKSQITFNVSKGARFATEAVPTNAKVVNNYYDSITKVGNLVVFGNKTELLQAGEVQNPEAPKLIFGYSGNDNLPYQLCEKICTVNWMSKGELIDTVDYADGLYIDYMPPTLGAYFNPEDNNLVYEEVHKGWATTEDGTEFIKTVLINEDATYYAGFGSTGPAAIAEIDMSDPENPKPTKAYFTSIIDNTTEPFGEGKYVRFYSDVSLKLDTALLLNNGVTLDLAGYTLSRTESVSVGRQAAIIPLGKATVKNGTLKTTLLSAFVVEEGTELTVEGLTVSYSGTPLAYVGGIITLKDSAVKERGGSSEIPGIILESGVNAVSLDNTSVTLSGVLFTTSVTDGEDFNISINDCTSVSCKALLAIDKKVATSMTEAMSLNFNVTGSKITSDKVFDVSYSMDGTSKIDAVYNLSESLFTANPATSLVGNVKLGDGEILAHSATAAYPYAVSAGTVSMRFSMSLSRDMTASFYIPVSSPITAVTTGLGTYTPDTLKKTDIEGEEYYLVEISGISATNSLDPVPLTISFTGEGGNVYTSEISYMPTDYFASVIDSPDVNERCAAASAIRYISSVYQYTGATLPADFTTILTSESYISALREYKDVPVTNASVDKGNISLAFTGAQLYLSSCVDLRLNLKDTFSGTLVVAGKTYTVTDGKVGELDYITVSMSASELYSSAIAISGTAADSTEISGKYSLSAYVNKLSGDTTDLGNMLKSLYAWCYEASVLGNGGILPPTYIDTLPPSGIIWH